MLDALGGLLVALLMGGIGWVVFTDYRGAATWHVRRTVGLRPGEPVVRDKDRKDFDRQARLEHRLGAVFLGIGSVLAVLSAVAVAAQL